VNGKERVRVEQLSYFYNNNVTIRLPNQVKKLSRATATDYYWPSIELVMKAVAKMKRKD
jgi:hypothetical protein